MRSPAGVAADEDDDADELSDLLGHVIDQCDDDIACDGANDPEEEVYDSDGHEVQEGDVGDLDDDGAPPPEHSGDGGGVKPIYFWEELEFVSWREVHLATKQVTIARKDLLTQAATKVSDQSGAPQPLPLRNGTISLCSNAETVAFVMWRNAAIFQGWRLSIDKFGRVVSLMYARDKPGNNNGISPMCKLYRL